jgi:hypothetical protein
VSQTSTVVVGGFSVRVRTPNGDAVVNVDLLTHGVVIHDVNHILRDSQYRYRVHNAVVRAAEYIVDALWALEAFAPKKGATQPEA